MSHLRVVVVVLCLVLGSVLCGDELSSDVDVQMDEYQCMLGLQLQLDAKENAEKNNAATGSRKKRQVGFGYDLYPSLNRFGGGARGFFGDAVYNPVSYARRLPYLPDSYLSRFNNLPVFRFFNQFYPAGINRANNYLVRNYVRFNSGFSQALADFRALPVYNVRQVATTTVTTAESDLEASIFGLEGGTIRLVRRGCSLDGLDNSAFPCLTVRLRNPLFGNVFRRFAYIRGFNSNLGPGVIAG